MDTLRAQEFTEIFIGLIKRFQNSASSVSPCRETL
jgi:hypothetical protein